MNFWLKVLLWTLTILSILVGVILVVDLIIDKSGWCPKQYEMPNGIQCKQNTITGGGFGGATHEFYGCSDGKRYINPEYFKKVKECGGLR